jgi:hypothetical protein
MTGQIAFARTIRALDADDFRGSKLGLFFAIVLLALWTWWFFTPSVPNFAGRAEGSLTWYGPHQVGFGVFPTEASVPIDVGQNAQIRLGDRTVGARVESVGFLSHGVRLVMFEVPTMLYPPLPDRAAINLEAGRVSPATLVIRALQ